MTLLAPLMLWATLAQAPPSTLSGIVVDPSGRPVAGAKVWLTDQPWYTGTVLLAEARTDAEGRFSMPRPVEARGNGASMPVALWAHTPGHRLGLAAFPAELPAPEVVVRVEVGPPARTVIRLEAPDPATPIGGKVEVYAVHRRPGRMPQAMIQALAAPIDANGVATLDGYLPEDILGLDARTEGFGTQTRETDQPTPGDRTIRLRPVGGLSGKVVADDPAKLKGWKVSASTRPDDEPGYSGTVGHYWEDTDDQGRFRFPTLPSGHLTITAHPPEGVAYLADDVKDRKIEAGGQLEVDVPARRAVIVAGSVCEAGTGLPIPGVWIHLFMPGRNGSWGGVRTDEKGRYAQVVWPGEVSMFPPTGAPEHYLPPGATTVAKHVVPEGVERDEWPAIEMIRGVAIRGFVLDAQGRPVADAAVSARYPGDDTGDVTRARASTRTDHRGGFRIPGIAPGLEIRLSAKKGGDATKEPSTALAGAEQPISLTLARSDAVAIRGRILGPDGRPVPDALVLLRSKATGTGLESYQESSVDFDDVETIRTGADGAFETPRELDSGRRYRAEAVALGMARAQTEWIHPPATSFPDLKLRRVRGLRTVVGRVVDRAGGPVAGVVVSQAGDGPTPTRSVTDAGGRFRVGGILDDRAFLFARKEGFRFRARAIGPGSPEVEIVLDRVDEEAARLQPPESPMPRPEEKALARGLAAAVRAKIAAEPEDRGLKARLLAVEARLDPDRVIEQVQDQVIRADAVLADLALGLVEEDPKGALELVEADRSDPGAAVAYLALHDALPPAERDLRRDLLDRAERRARAMSGGPGMTMQPKIVLLAKVAARRLDAGDRDRAEVILREVRPEFAAMPASGSSFGDADVARAFARVDLPATLAFLGRHQATRQNNPGLYDIVLAGVAAGAAEVDPAEAERLLGQIRQDYTRKDATRRTCVRMAARDLDRARRLAATLDDPAFPPLLAAVAARATARTDPRAARALLDSAFSELERLAQSPAGRWARSTYPAAMASCLPVAERIDPSLVPEYLARALAARPSRTDAPDQEGLPPAALLAQMLARYDAEAASIVFSRVPEDLFAPKNNPSGIESQVVSAVLLSAATFDPGAALAILARMPDDPKASGNDPWGEAHRKADARLTVATALSRPAAARRIEAARTLNRDWPGELLD